MPEPFHIVSRVTIGLDPVVRSHGVPASAGKPRPRLTLEPWLTVHYTGVDVMYVLRDTPATILAIDQAARARPAPAPNEYNYVIDRKQGPEVYEYAGEFAAAHSAGENESAVGVLLLNGTREPVTDLQVQKVRWLRDRVLLPRMTLAIDHRLTPHRLMPGAATACPGELVMQRWSELDDPFVPLPDPPKPPPVGLDIMRGKAIPTGTWKNAYGRELAWFALFDSGVVRHCSGPDTALWPNAVAVPIEGPAHWNQLARVANFYGAELQLVPE